jgi:hypothetical protein
MLTPFQRSTSRSLSIGALVMCCWLTPVRPAQADTLFAVSGTFADNNSTALTGTITLSAATGNINGFSFNIPTMTTGSTTLPGALFTPATATPSFSSFGPGAFVTFQLFGAPPQGEELFLLIPAPVANPYTGGPLLQQLTFQAQVFHTGYQSGGQANPFFQLSRDGSITLVSTPEPSSYLFLGFGIAGILLKRGLQFMKAN